MDKVVDVNDSDDDLLFTSSSQIKNKKKVRNISNRNNLHNKFNSNNSIELLDDDEEVMTTISRNTNNNYSSSNVVIPTKKIEESLNNNVDDCIDLIQDDEQILKAKRLFSSLHQAKEKFTLNSSSTMDNNKKSVDTSANDLPTISDVIIPKIKSTAERLLEAQNKTVALEALNNHKNSNNDVNNKNENTKSNNTKLIKLKTRLNGKHEWKWKISATDKFDKVKLKFSEIYGVDIKELKFIFDGEKLSDEDTPQDLDMEDDTIIDVKINANLLDNAIAKASTYTSNKLTPQVSTSSSHTSSIEPVIDRSKPNISLTTITIHFTSVNSNTTNTPLIIAITNSTTLSFPLNKTLDDLKNELIKNSHIKSNESIELTLKSTPNIVLPFNTIISQLIPPIELMVRPGRYEIFIKPKNINKKNLKLILRGDYQISHVIQEVCNKWGININNIILEFNNNIIGNYQLTLKDCGLISGSIVYVSSK